MERLWSSLRRLLGGAPPCPHPAEGLYLEVAMDAYVHAFVIRCSRCEGRLHALFTTHYEDAEPSHLDADRAWCASEAGSAAIAASLRSLPQRAVPWDDGLRALMRRAR